MHKIDFVELDQYRTEDGILDLSEHDFTKLDQFDRRRVRVSAVVRLPNFFGAHVC
jgi:hypothetical protein